VPSPISSGSYHRPISADPASASGARGSWEARDAFTADLRKLLERGGITASDVDGLTGAAGDNVERYAFLYLSLIRRGLAFEPDAATRLRTFLSEKGANDVGSTLSRLVARHLGEDPTADEADFGREVTGALTDRSVTLEEAQGLIREAGGNTMRMAMLDLALKTRELDFREDATKALRTYLIRAGLNEPDSDLSKAIAELRVIYGDGRPA
jgi:hypothetical protein